MGQEEKIKSALETACKQYNKEHMYELLLSGNDEDAMKWVIAKSIELLGQPQQSPMKTLQECQEDFWNFGYADYDLSTDNENFDNLEQDVVNEIFKAGWEAHASQTQPAQSLPVTEGREWIDFKDLPIDIVDEIARLAFGHKEWITSSVSIRYQPHMKEHYEDAEEFFEATFEGYFMADKTAWYKVQLRPTRDIAMWYSFGGENNQLLHVSNQFNIQRVLSEYLEPSPPKH